LIQVYFWSGTDPRLINLEIVFGAKPRKTGDDVRREHSDARIEIARIPVIKAPRDLDAILGIGEFLLQGEKFLVGLQREIAFADSKQLAKSTHQDILVARLR
jgi:hypothetical protein